MAEVEGQEKTEQASGKKLKEARDKGQVAKSTEITSFGVFSTGILMTYLTQKFISNQFSEFSTKIFSTLDNVNFSREVFRNFSKETLYFFIATLAPVLGAVFVISFIANVAQIGFKISPKALEPKLSKLNPLKGIKNTIFSSKSLVELIKSIVKLIVISWFTYVVASKFIINSGLLIELSVPEIVRDMIEGAFGLLWKISIIYVLIAVADFIFQKRKFKKDMMMTKKEVKEENKQAEGDPAIKSRIKKMQYQAAKNRMMQSVPKADVIITNPTHYAIALKYDVGQDTAPKVLAKGVDELAQRIKAIANENNIPLHEDRELARALYKVCNIGDEVPASLFKAVAKVLAYIYQLKNNVYKKNSII